MSIKKLGNKAFRDPNINRSAIPKIASDVSPGELPIFPTADKVSLENVEKLTMPSFFTRLVDSTADPEGFDHHDMF